MVSLSSFELYIIASSVSRHFAPPRDELQLKWCKVMSVTSLLGCILIATPAHGSWPLSWSQEPHRSVHNTRSTGERCVHHLLMRDSEFSLPLPHPQHDVFDVCPPLLPCVVTTPRITPRRSPCRATMLCTSWLSAISVGADV